jgi:hypothetical protein
LEFLNQCFEGVDALGEALAVFLVPLGDLSGFRRAHQSDDAKHNNSEYPKINYAFIHGRGSGQLGLHPTTEKVRKQCGCFCLCERSLFPPI